MGQVIPKQHPSVVLRSHFNAVRALLAVALVAIVALATTVVIVANDDEATNSAAPAAEPAAQPQTLPPGPRFDGGPDEGSRGPQSYWESRNPRSSYQPAPADGTKARAGGPSLNLQGGPGAR